ncbi:unnamed protein product, partial [Trichobilharzia regenti]
GIPSDPANVGDEVDNDDDGNYASSGVDSQEKRDRKLKQNTAKLSKQKMAEIQRMIEADRRKLEEQKDMAVEERNRIQVRDNSKRDDFYDGQFVFSSMYRLTDPSEDLKLCNISKMSNVNL